MRRREFITLLGGAAVAWPLAARAQQPAMPVIGFLSTGSLESDAVRLAAVSEGLSETGYVEGRNVAIEYRGAQDQYDRLPALATDLVNRRVDAIITVAAPAALAAKSATTTIPIVFNLGLDPVELGLVASLNRPAGNLTGVSLLTSALVPKRLELLHELLPAAAIFALLINPTNPSGQPEVKEGEDAARALGLRLHVFRADTVSDIDDAFANLVGLKAGALIVGADPFFIRERDQIVALANRHTLPTIYAWREFTDAGGLMSYGTSLADSYRLAGQYLGKILKGANPANLPVQQVVKVELIVNLKTAKTLGLTIPLPLLGRADEVIE